MISRSRYESQLKTALGRAPVVAMLGPRQCGKTTLAKHISTNTESVFFDLESPRDRLRLSNPEDMLGCQKGLVIIDEVQLAPELFPILRVLADRHDNPARFLILGSASPEIVRGVSESLAGRIEFVELTGFRLDELTATAQNKLWLRGGFPRSFLAPGQNASNAWREQFIRTFLERDLPQLGISIPSAAMRRFWTMLAHYHGQLWNASGIGRSMGLNDKTVRNYLDILSGAYMLRQLQPWHENIGKRQVKSPKVYLRDSGLLHSLLTLDNDNALTGHPIVGASWEGFAIEQILSVTDTPQFYFWRTHSGAELDLLLIKNGRKFGIEFKYSESPKITRSMRGAVEDLALEHLWIVCITSGAFPLADNITASGIRQFIHSWHEITEGR